MAPPPLPLVTRPSLVGGEPLYLSGEDALRLTAFNALTGVTLTLSGRFLPVARDDQDVPRPGPFIHVLVPASDRTASVITRGLGEGWLLEASVVASVATPQVGQCYCVLSIVRGLGASALELSTLAEGYVTSKQRIAWPGGLFGASLDGGGALRSITGATPAAGAEISETVPTGARWELLSLEFFLTTAVAVAARNVGLILDDGANVFWRTPNVQTQAASLSFRYDWFQGGTKDTTGASGIYANPIPTGIRLSAGFRIRTGTGLLQAADQFTAVQYLVREWIEGA
jgi:hypothetical protein